MLSVAQDEADRTSERIKAVFDAKRDRNEMPSGSLPKGYRREGSAIVLDEEMAPVVRAAFELYLETGSPSKVIRAFPELHLDYKSARYMFASPSYAGTISGVTIPAIITMEEHEQALRLHGKVTRKTKSNRIYLFSGLINCPECGGRMGGRHYPQKHGDRLYYVCGKGARLGRCKNTKNYNEKMIEQYLLDHIDGKLTLMLDLQRKQPANHKQQREALKRKLSLLSELWVDELISKEDYKRQYRELTEALAVIPEDEPPVDVQTIKAHFSGDWKTTYSQLPPDGKRAFWRQCIKTISLNLDTSSVRDFDLQ